MKTPKNYVDNLKKNIITTDMVKDCAYSVNKRAKNCRDKIREYRAYSKEYRELYGYSYDKFHTIENYKATETEYYNLKEKLLSILSPVCIHCEFAGFKRIKVKEYEADYDVYAKSFVYEGSYYDYQTGNEVYFGEYEDKNVRLYRYYLFYQLGDHSFHLPIDEKDIEKHTNLQLVDIDTLHTKGKNTSDLISVPFVRKVVALIESGNYTYVSA